MSPKDNIKPYREDIDVGQPDSILSGLYRTILHELGIEESRWESLVHKYITRTIKDVSAKELSSVRSNFRNELMKSVMTWKVFNKGLQVINIKEYDVGLQVWFNDESRESVSALRTVKLNVPADDKQFSYDTALSYLFNQLMVEMHMDPVLYSELLVLYIRRSKVPINQKEISSERGNVNKELTNPRMSWKVSIKGLNFLDVKNFVFVVRLKHFRGDSTSHKRYITLEQFY